MMPEQCVLNKKRVKMKVSVIIPLRNAEPFIGRCLDSIVSQSHQEMEIIVVDDKSTDASLSIVEKYAKQHSALRVIRHDYCTGTMTCRCDGYQAATGECLLFVDADDTLPQDAIAKLVELQEQTGADIVTGNAVKICQNGRQETLTDALPAQVGVEDFLEAMIDGKARYSLWGRLYRTALFQKHELWHMDNMMVYEDACLLFQALEFAKKLSFADVPVYEYHENRKGSSLRTMGRREMESFIVANKVISDVCLPYARIADKTKCRISRNLFALYGGKVSLSKLNYMLEKYDMRKFTTIRAAFKYLRFSDFVRLVKRRFSF